MYDNEDVSDDWRCSIIVTLTKKVILVIATTGEASHYFLLAVQYSAVCCYTGRRTTMFRKKNSQGSMLRTVHNQWTEFKIPDASCCKFDWFQQSFWHYPL